MARAKACGRRARRCGRRAATSCGQDTTCCGQQQPGTCGFGSLSGVPAVRYTLALTAELYSCNGCPASGTSYRTVRVALPPTTWERAVVPDPGNVFLQQLDCARFAYRWSFPPYVVPGTVLFATGCPQISYVVSDLGITEGAGATSTPGFEFIPASRRVAMTLSFGYSRFGAPEALTVMGLQWNGALAPTVSFAGLPAVVTSSQDFSGGCRSSGSVSFELHRTCAQSGGNPGPNPASPWRDAVGTLMWELVRPQVVLCGGAARAGCDGCGGGVAAPTPAEVGQFGRGAE